MASSLLNSMQCNITNYTHAIVQRIPSVLKSYDGHGFDLLEAEKEHKNFVSILKQIVPVIEFDEDILIRGAICLDSALLIYHGFAILTRSKTLYSTKFLKFLLKNSLTVVDISDPNIKLDGSDVLFTGNEFFVGITEWTNEAGANFLGHVCPEYTVTPIYMQSNRNLKYYVSMARPGVLCYSDHAEAKRIASTISNITCYDYMQMVLQEKIAPHILSVNGTLIHRSPEEIPCSIETLRSCHPKVSVKFEVLGMPIIGNQFSSYCVLFIHPNKIRSL